MDDQTDRYGFLTKTLLPLACLVVIIAGIRAAASIVVPLLLAIFIAVILMPPFIGLQKLRLRPSIAMVIIILGLLSAGFLIMRVMSQSIQNFIDKLPAYQETLMGYKEQFVEWLNKKGADALSDSLNDYVKPETVANYAKGIAVSLSQLVSQAALILLIVIFLLFEASIIPGKLRSMPNFSDETMSKLRQMVETVRRYLGIKTFVSLLTGGLVSLWLVMLRQDYAIPFGMLAFLLNYVPNIGSAVAAIPAILLALLEGGIKESLLCTLGYLIINIGLGNFLEPKILGRGLGISPAFVLITMLFWGWALGPVGMLLSVPLTMVFKIALESHPETKWLSILLGSSTNGKIIDPPKDTEGK
jgi:AI-2 transport protein TqsA